jgi:hypothetical protein
MRHVPTAATALVLLGIGALIPSSLALATDQPIGATKLVLQRHNGKEKLIFSSKDPAFLFPGVGSADDPSTAGMVIEILSGTEGTFNLPVPAGAGKPGWTSKTTPVAQHQFKNSEAPSGISLVKTVLLKQGKRLKIDSRAAMLPLLAATTRVAIRITTGGLRTCALFTAPDARKNETNRFVAGKVPPPGGSADCSDAILLGTSLYCDGGVFPTCGGECTPGETCVGDGLNGTCKCIAPGMPCGDTNPTCNGACPIGQECVSFGLDTPYNGCGCVPAGSTPCGTPNAPTCGGACPSGTTCSAIFRPLELGGGVDCDCRGPGTACGNGAAFGGAPNEGQPYGCYPITCTGSYPTCGGPCLDGGVCDAFRISSFAGCVCAVPAPCGGGGFDCGPGDVCRLDPPTVMCGVP